MRGVGTWFAWFDGVLDGLQEWWRARRDRRRRQTGEEAATNQDRGDLHSWRMFAVSGGLVALGALVNHVALTYFSGAFSLVGIGIIAWGCTLGLIPSADITILYGIDTRAAIESDNRAVGRILHGLFIVLAVVLAIMAGAVFGA
jgi:hypothetical protein